MPIISDPRDTETALVGAVNSALLTPADGPLQKPALLDVAAAASRQATLGGSAYARLVEHPDPDLPDAPPGYDPLDHIQGYEDEALHFVRAQSPSEVEGIKQRLNAQRADQDVLRRAGLGGTGSQLVMTMLDPSFLVAAAVPELAMAKASRIGRVVDAALKGAAGASAYEYGMQNLQDNRTFQESLFNIGGGALMSGVLGSLGRRVPTAEMNAARDKIAADLHSQPSTVGAASTRPDTTIEQETIARGGATISKALNKTLFGTDLDVAMNADSVVARQIYQELADVTPLTEKNFEGIATPTSVESLTMKHEARVADLVDLAHEQLATYKLRVPKSDRLSDDEWWRAVSTAARNEDHSLIPEIEKTAQFLRKRVFDPLYQDAKDLGIVRDPAKEAQAALDTERVHEHVGKETQRLFEDFTKRASDADELESFEVIRKVRQKETEALSAIPPQVTGKNLTAEVAKIRGRFQTEVDKFAAPLQTRFINRARAVHEGRATDADAAVNELAATLKKQELGQLLGKEVPHAKAEVPTSVVGAKSYFRRMYDRNAIRANLAEWHKILETHFAESSDALPAEIAAATEDVTKTILGNDVGQSNWNTKIAVSKAGPLHERVLDIPDSKIEKFLVNDPLRVARAYVRDLAPQVELARRFHGDVEMKQAFQNIADDYGFKREAVRNNKQLSATQQAKQLERLTKNEKAVNEAILRTRARILGTAARLASDASEGARRAVRVSKGWRNIVAAGKLGVTAITGGLMDTARIAAQYGFLPTISTLTKLVSSPEFRALSKEQARRAGSAVEVALSRRVNAAYDGAITEGWTEKMANGLYKWSGLNHITDFNRTLAATLLEDSVIKAAREVKAGRTLPKYTRGSLASLGLGDDELTRIAEQIEKHGGDVDGIAVSGSADWDSKALADIYDAAILKESKIVVQQPGAADRVWWMDKELGKFIGQLKSFALSSPSRLLTPGAQMLGAGEHVRGARFFGFMMIGGYLTHALRQVVAGQQPATDPLTAANEAFNESGLGGILPDLVSPLARRVGFMSESARYSDRNVMGAFGGPALGAFGDAYDLAMNRTANGVNAKDLHLIRRLLPYQNIWWARRAINALEGETAEAMDLPGADTQSFGQRFLETKPPLASQDRGGTGTGKLVQ